jgi:hypothetical protein
LLTDATVAATEKMHFNLAKVSLPEVKDLKSKSVFDLLELQQVLGLDHLKIGKSDWKSDELDGSMLKLLEASTNWELASLKLGQESRVSLQEVRGQKLDFLHIETATCWGDNVKMLCLLLAEAQVHWRINTLELMHGTTQESWTALARVAKKGSLGTVRVSVESLKRSTDEDIQALWTATDGGWGGWSGEGRVAYYAKQPKDEAGKLLKKKNDVIYISKRQMQVAQKQIKEDRHGSQNIQLMMMRFEDESWPLANDFWTFVPFDKEEDNDEYSDPADTNLADPADNNPSDPADANPADTNTADANTADANPETKKKKKKKRKKVDIECKQQ